MKRKLIEYRFDYFHSEGNNNFGIVVNSPLILSVPASSVKILLFSMKEFVFLYQVITGGGFPSAMHGRTATDPSGLV